MILCPVKLKYGSLLGIWEVLIESRAVQSLFDTRKVRENSEKVLEMGSC